METGHADLLMRKSQVLERLRIHSEAGNRAGMASDHNELGNLYIHLRDYKMAAEHFRKAFETRPGAEPGAMDEMHVLKIVPQDFSQVNVLIVEDNKINQLLLKNMLKRFGFPNSDSVDDGTTALARIAENKYDLILMDIQMPGMDGYEITTRIRTTMRDCACIPIIALTGDASVKEKEKARAGAHVASFSSGDISNPVKDTRHRSGSVVVRSGSSWPVGRLDGSREAATGRPAECGCDRERFDHAIPGGAPASFPRIAAARPDLS